MTRYLTIAWGLGAGWFVIFLLPAWTRNYLLYETGWNIAFLMLSSAITAIVFRRFVSRARTFGQHLIRAITIPYVGCVFYLTFCVGKMLIHAGVLGQSVNLREVAVFYYWGILSAVFAFPLVIIFGLVCQYVMHWAASQEHRSVAT